MTIEHFSKQFSSPFLPGVRDWCDSKPRHTLVKGCCSSGDALVIADLFRSSGCPVFVFVENGKRAENLVEECRTFLGDEHVELFPSRDAVPYTMKSPFGPTVEARFRVLGELLDNQRKVFVAPHAALTQKLATQKNLFNRIIRLRSGDDVPPATLSEWLTENGFHRETSVTNLGTFSVRGGIMDIYPFLSENPLRIEYWGDTIESIREFDVFTQKTLLPRTRADIFPMREFCLSSSDVDYALENMRETARSRGGDPLSIHRFEHQWKTGADLEGVEWFLHWFDLPTVSLFDYLSPETIVVWDDFIPPLRRFDETVQNYERHLSRVPEIFLPFVSKPHELLLDKEQLEARLLSCTSVFFDTLDTPADAAPLQFDFTEQPMLPPEFGALASVLAQHHANGLRCVVLSPNKGHAERLAELLSDSCPFVEIALGYLGKGFIAQACRMLLFSETQIMGRSERPTRIKKRKNAIPITGFDTLSPGDFVVHEDHGIAKFLGVERVAAGEGHSDCMVLLFDANARVYVPVDDFHKVQKYIGKESVAPALSRIGTASWERLKERTRESLKEMANELIELYARRQFLEGIAFGPDSPWQKEYEDAFVYEETVDQLRAINEVKADMEAKKPMDRLVCGDVGFGKTEVAMRAAFKAVMAGYQVAVLAPTTILAAQHVAVFTERMASFPIKIGHLSRFVRAKEQKTVVERIAAGDIDLVIGTHRVLSKDIRFKNLGLLIIDEEQRFGVRHKEKLKQFKFTIDVLSLTATPIPRTLHMSLVGARDLSIIATPPRNRLPVETSVAEFHDDLVKRAIETELDRGGQVYFVNNRIKNLELLRDRIAQLVPRARTVTAHGQMDERELETVMKAFVAGRYDVLLSTVIIENGLDIQNVNTIIINRADTMGLSQLYQLRGRVGRSSEQAYAYLLTPPSREVSEEALQRLRALEQYTELGSGFQIAMRDLEIRGAGNLLGTHQHGFIAAVGFELYCRLLQEAVREVRGEKPPEKISEVKLDVPLEAYIPNDYIADGTARIELYQELSAILTDAALSEFEKGIADRFGPMPQSVAALMLLMRIKFAARSRGISRVTLNRIGGLALFFSGEADAVRKNVMAFMQECPVAFEVTDDSPHAVLKTTLHEQGKKEMARDVLTIITGEYGR